MINDLKEVLIASNAEISILLGSKFRHRKKMSDIIFTATNGSTILNIDMNPRRFVLLKPGHYYPKVNVADLESLLSWKRICVVDCDKHHMMAMAVEISNAKTITIDV
uniref:Uncharacterized protein n=1 Tax=Glossina pallidipes TaxID=7398 RepID=A0A1B0A4C0_GLOPL